jgi:cytochrome d ubiquinol oxidase subunit II
MLGRYVLGFRAGWEAEGFALLSALGLAAAYALVGACWLIAKTEGDLQARAVVWAKRALIATGLGMLFISAVTPMVSDRIFVRWFSFPNIIGLLPIPLMTGAMFLSLWVFLRRMPRADHGLDIVPFLGASSLFVLGFFGLAYSFWPYVVPERLTIWEAASAPESLWIILMGALVVLPMIIGYTVLSYWVFRGKASELHYD